MLQDLGLALREERQHGAVLRVTALVAQFYGELQARGLWDGASLLKLVACEVRW